MRLRRFTRAGLARFERFLEEAADRKESKAAELLLASDSSEEVGARVDVEAGALDGTRLNAAGYLDRQFAAGGLLEPEGDAGLWAWLTALYFDLVCPRDRGGALKPGSSARYLPVLDDSRRTYRHALLGPYLIFRAHRDDPYRALSLLCQPLSRPGRLVERLASRPRLVACPAAIGAATLLYCDRRGSIRRGAAASVERLSDVLMQLDRTYDLYGMTADALLKLLPREFDGFLKSGTKLTRRRA